MRPRPKLLSKDRLFLPLVVLGVFLGASVLTLALTGNQFFLFDLPFIGVSVFLGMVFDRRITQFLVGFYFLLFLNLTLRVNMQIEGLWLQVFAGIFSAAFVHFAMAKLLGPLMFGRGFCAYGCWTAAILDFLPWRRSPGRRPGLGALRYVHLGLTLVLAGVLFFALDYRQPPGAPDSVPWFLVGISAYWVLGIALAWGLKDNRAFCKILCPIAPLMKIPARWSRMKVRLDRQKCTQCGACEKVCPMDVKILQVPAQDPRVHSTECIQCGSCTGVCPPRALSTDFRILPRRKAGA